MKINAVVDLNYIFHKTFGIFSGFGSKTPDSVLSSEEDKNMFIKKIITDISYLLNQIPDLGAVVFCRDSRSWRKDYKITRSVYKESRVKGEKVDWGSFFMLMDEFGDYFSSKGFIYSSHEGAEADDLIWAWSEYFKEKGEKTIILSGDKDMHQLAHFNKSTWTAIWSTNSKNNKLVVSEDWDPQEEESTTIFDVTPSSGEFLSKIQKLISSCQLQKINVKEYVFKKILSGDRDDDVHGVFPHETKNGKISNIAEGKALKIWKAYLETSWSHLPIESIWKDDEFLDWVSGVGLRMLGQTDSKENREIFKKYYDENARLVWLNTQALPETLSSSLMEHVKSLGKNVKNIISVDKKSLIKESKWDSPDSPPKAFDPFALF